MTGNNAVARVIKAFIGKPGNFIRHITEKIIH